MAGRWRRGDVKRKRLAECGLAFGKASRRVSASSARVSASRGRVLASRGSVLASRGRVLASRRPVVGSRRSGGASPGSVADSRGPVRASRGRVADSRAAVVALRGGTQEIGRVTEIGKLLVVGGVVMALLGLALWSGVGAGWLGRLPGDIRIERGNSGFYFPVVTCIVISIVLTVIMSLFRR